MEKIKISEHLRDYIEGLHYETYAIQDLILRMKNIDDNELNSFWLDKYTETYKKYILAKQELEKQYLIPKFGNDITWNLDFDSCEVSINR